MEVFISIGWENSESDNKSLKWLADQNLILKLVELLNPNSRNSSCINASRCLIDILTNCSPLNPNELINEFYRKPIIDKLFLFLKTTRHGLRIDNYNNNNNNNIPFGCCLSVVTVAIQAFINFKTSNSDFNKENHQLPILGMALDSMEDVFVLLDLNEQEKKQERTEKKVKNLKMLGDVRLKLVEYLLILLNTNESDIYKQIGKQEILSRLMNLFLYFENNNLFHGLVDYIFQIILENDDTFIKESLFCGGFLNQVQWGIEHNKAMRPIRLGYMGHLIKICTRIHILLGKSKKLQKALHDSKRRSLWDKLFSSDLEKEFKIIQIGFGEHKYSGSRPAASAEIAKAMSFEDRSACSM